MNLKNVCVLFFFFSSICSCGASIKTEVIDPLDVNNDDSIVEQTVKIFSGEGKLILFDDGSGIFKGYYEYGTSNEENHCSTYFMSSNDRNNQWVSTYYGFYSDFDENMSLFGGHYLDTGFVFLTDSMIELRNGGGSLCRRYVDFDNILSLSLEEVTNDSFYIIINNHPLLYSIEDKNSWEASLYEGMMIRSLESIGDKYVILIDGKRYLIGKKDCKAWSTSF